MLGRALVHTDFLTGVHSEPENPIFKEQVGRLRTAFQRTVAADCKGAMPPDVGKPLLKYLVKVGSDAKGTPHPKLGSVLQPLAAKGVTPEGSVAISSWTTSQGPMATAPSIPCGGPLTSSSASCPSSSRSGWPFRSPIGMGLLEAVDERPSRTLPPRNGGHMNIVTDPEDRRVADGPLRVQGQPGHPEGSDCQASQRRPEHHHLDLPDLRPRPEQPDLDSRQTGWRDSGPGKHLSLLLAAGRAAPAGLPRRAGREGRETVPPAQLRQLPRSDPEDRPLPPPGGTSRQTIHPYTDMLLHDMGTAWRTTWATAMPTGPNGGRARCGARADGPGLSTARPTCTMDGPAP